MRKYSLVILGLVDEVEDRFDFGNIIVNPTGNGFKLNLSTISGDVEDIVTKVTQEKGSIKFSVYQKNHSYTRANILANWIQKYSTANYKMALEYDDGNLIKYCEGKVVNLTKNEKDDYGVLVQDLEFKQTSPYFVKRENTITFQTSKYGKKYSYRYPYSYGSMTIANNEIDNPYILDIPLIISIDGTIDNPTIKLLDDKENVYNTVIFEDETLHEGERLVINSAQKKIYKFNIDENGVEIPNTRIDYRPKVSPDEDTFLRAKNGKSVLSINVHDTSEKFRLTGGWREYSL